MSDDDLDLQRQLAKKAARKAKPGGMPKWINLPRNWLHQAWTYMDTGEMWSKVIIEALETTLLFLILRSFVPDLPAAIVLSMIIVHTWNWITNGLFWAVIIFTFPSLRNPGAEATVKYLHDMKQRLLRYKSVTGLALYGSITRHAWHDRSDIDLRIIRKPGVIALFVAVYLTMKERFIAFFHRQPMDLYLADSVDFLKKLRSDEKPLLLIKRSKALEEMYPGNDEQDIGLHHFKSE